MVAVGSTPQTSGTSANNFTSPVIYTVTAADASTQTYSVTVTENSSLVIGQSYGGGKVAYILQSGDPGYSGTVQHGLIAATGDQDAGSGIIWALVANESTSVPGTSTGIGTGMANTIAIVAQNGAGSTYAAGLARAYTDGVYTDWYLPSKDELYKLYLKQVAIGGFNTTPNPCYWSSSEYEGSVDSAWHQDFDNGNRTFNYKFNSDRVRAVRAF